MIEAKLAIVDFGMGNLFSVLRACEHVGARAEIVSTPEGVESADALILPGVGAFGDAMTNLRERGLVNPILSTVSAGKPFLGVCLGMQLLMERSYEFGEHAGLGLIAGAVERIDPVGTPPAKVPQVCWNRLARPDGVSWDGSVLEGLRDGEHMYFVHSYRVKPRDPEVILSNTEYGGVEFCSTLCRGKVFACQYHPERSGEAGLRVYRNFVKMIGAT